MSCTICDAPLGTVCKMPNCGALQARQDVSLSKVKLTDRLDGVVLRIGAAAAVMTLGEWSELIARPDRAPSGPLRSV